MTPEQIIKKVRSLEWDEWLNRPFRAFILSLFKDGMDENGMKKIGINAGCGIFLFERGAWYRNPEARKKFKNEIKKHIEEGGSIFDVSESCEKFYVIKKKRIIELIKEQKDPIKKLKELYEIVSVVISYIWAAHGMEDVYNEILHKELPKYIKGDIEKYIGDISFPIKKNAYTLMEEAMSRGDSLESVIKEFAWVKCRDGFSDGFTVKELETEKTRFDNQKKGKPERIEVPGPLKKLAKEMQELVYFRTLRTDVLYEFLFLARPILKEVAKKYNLDFNDLRDCAIQDLIAGKPKKQNKDVCWVYYKGNIFFFDKPILEEKKIESETVKGTVAFGGNIRGIAKVVRDINDIGKIEVGNILIAHMTSPNFLVAMKKASAFVTDEGGITCHASIVAREMKKPCVIGTKIATKVIKDGDLVEVDADKGVVRIVKRK